jgi:hypothetical protein
MHAGNNFFAWGASLLPEAWLESIPFIVISYGFLIVVLPYALYQLYKIHAQRDVSDLIIENPFNA